MSTKKKKHQMGDAAHTYYIATDVLTGDDIRNGLADGYSITPASGFTRFTRPDRPGKAWVKQMNAYLTEMSGLLDATRGDTEQGKPVPLIAADGRIDVRLLHCTDGLIEPDGAIRAKRLRGLELAADAGLNRTGVANELSNDGLQVLQVRLQRLPLSCALELIELLREFVSDRGHVLGDLNFDVHVSSSPLVEGVPTPRDASVEAAPSRGCGTGVTPPMSTPPAEGA